MSLKAFHFCLDFHLKSHLSFDFVFGPRFQRSWCLNMILRGPLVTSWAHNNTQNPPGGAKRLPKSIRGGHFLRCHCHLARPKGTRGRPKHPLDTFLYIFDGFGVHFLMTSAPPEPFLNHFGHVWTSTFWILFTRRQAPPRSTQESASFFCTKWQGHNELLKA